MYIIQYTIHTYIITYIYIYIYIEIYIYIYRFAPNMFLYILCISSIYNWTWSVFLPRSPQPLAFALRGLRWWPGGSRAALISSFENLGYHSFIVFLNIFDIYVYLFLVMSSYFCLLLSISEYFWHLCLSILLVVRNIFYFSIYWE